LLRRTMDLGPTQQISFGSELDLLGCYLDIQKARFGDRLRVTFAVDPDARAAAVPVLLLQPLVENAIRHGLAERVASGRIEIAARRDGGQLLVTVTDDGAGARVSSEGPHGERVGLGNTRARLEVLYGGQQRLELSNGPAGGARVTLQIPYR